MIRTQISLDEEDYALARKEAKALGIPVAELFRRALRQVIPPSQKSQGPWMRFAGLVESGDTRSSERIDEVVYGQKD